MKSLSKLVMILLGGMTLAGCSPYRELAQQYVDQSSKRAVVYLIHTGYVDKVNLKRYPTLDLSAYTQYQRDSIRFEKSIFLKNLSDSIFLTRFVNSYMEELRALGVRVCLDGPDSLTCLPAEDSWIVIMDHLELREFNIPITDEQYIYPALYQKDIDLEAVSLHALFSINRLNEDKKEQQLYAENYVSDEITESGFGFEKDKDKVVHYRKVQPLTLKMIYNMAEALGRKYASYTYDYLLNEYIFKSSKSVPSTYYHYNRFKNKLEEAGDDRFIAK
ncbi:MAG: hypothetical protein WBJ48_10380 [Bacteroidales bacterium]